jgi:hypothetical protein
MLSESATQSIFGWLRVSGWPETEREIFCHSWFVSEGSDKESNVIVSAEMELRDASDIGRWVEQWLERQYGLEIDDIKTPKNYKIVLHVCYAVL